MVQYLLQVAEMQSGKLSVQVQRLFLTPVTNNDFQNETSGRSIIEQICFL